MIATVEMIATTETPATARTPASQKAINSRINSNKSGIPASARTEAIAVRTATVRT